MAGDDRTQDGQTRAHVEQAFMDLLARKGIEPGEDGKLDFSKAKREDVEGMLPELVSTTFGALFESVASQAAAGPAPEPPAADEEPVPIDLDAERAKRQGRTTTAAEEELASNVRGALGKVVARAAEKDGNLKVDADFVKDHGGELMGALFGAIAQSFLPKGSTTFKVSVPAEDADSEAPKGKKKADKPREVDVNLDLGSLFGGLIETAVRQARDQAAKAPAPADPAADDDDDADDDADGDGDDDGDDD